MRSTPSRRSFPNVALETVPLKNVLSEVTNDTRVTHVAGQWSEIHGKRMHGVRFLWEK